MNYELYPATIQDKDFIYEFKKSCIIAFVEEIWGWDENYQIKDFDENFILHNFQIIVVDNQQIGFIETNNTNSNINITELHLLNEYRGNGIGTSIIKNIITNTEKEKKSVTVGCFKKNIKAKNLYERLGFIIENESETHYEMRLGK